MEVGKEINVKGESAIGIQQGKNDIMNLMLAYIESMALKCIVELQIPDIIHSHGSPLSLSQIATKIGSPSLNLSYLSRVMRLLVHKNVFSAATTTSSDETLYYDLTHSSRLLLHGCDLMSMVPILMMNTHPRLVEPWHCLSASIKDDENAIKKAYGSSLWELLSTDSNLNSMFNSGLEGITKFSVKTILESYKDGFMGIKTLVDVGGGTGYLLSEVVKANWPHITGINFELQHVVETAPSYRGITHVEGDMFESIPTADAIIMKSVLHNWNDEDCKKVLRNCKRSLSKAAGKLILVEIVDEAKEFFNETTVKLDLLMMVHCIGGKERTKLEWTNLLEDAGFSRIAFIKIPAIHSIIEAHA